MKLVINSKCKPRSTSAKCSVWERQRKSKSEARGNLKIGSMTLNREETMRMNFASKIWKHAKAYEWLRKWEESSWRNWKELNYCIEAKKMRRVHLTQKQAHRGMSWKVEERKLRNLRDQEKGKTVRKTWITIQTSIRSSR